MAASAGTVTLELDANSVKLIRELQKAQKQTKRSAFQMRREMKQAFTNMGRAAAAFGVALTAVTKVSIDFADRIGKTADKLGIGVEALQEFRFAAKRAGIEQNTLDMALQRFTRRAAEAARGTGEAKKALQEMGIQLTGVNGQLRPTEDLLRDVADAMQKNYAPADQLRVAFKLFDSEGAALVNMLRDGSDGLNDYARQARDLGVVMDESLVRNAEEAADRMGDLAMVLKVSVATQVTENADAIITLTNALIDFVGVVGRAVGGWNDWMAAQGIGVNTIDEIRERGSALLRERQVLEQKLQQGGMALTQGADSRHRIIQFLFGDKDEMRAEIQRRIDEINKEMATLQDRAVDMQKGTGAESSSADNPAFLPILPEPKAEKEKADQVAQIIADLQNQIRSFGGDEFDRALLQIVDEGATEEQIQLARTLITELRVLEADEQRREESAQRRADLESEYASLVAQTRTDVEIHAALLERINEMYATGVIPNAEAYGELVGRLNEEFQATQDRMKSANDELDEFGKQAARNMQTHLADFLFNPFDEGLDGMLKGFSETIRRMAAEAAAAAIFKKLFGEEGGEGGVLSGIFGGSSGGGLGSFIGALFGGARALGGPVHAGLPYLVGERGPEIVVPKSMGTVVPNDQIGGTRQNITNVYLPPEVPRRTAQQTAYEIANRTQRAQARNR